MTFAEAEAYLLSLGNEVAAMKLGLDSVSTLLKALGDPQKNYLKVQVAGTNGKGSVCAFLDSICRTAGVKVGLYTSPHLISITERIRIGGEDVREVEFARLSTNVREASEQLVASGELPSVPTFFEQVTAVALLAFAEAKVQLAILETGLGGRLDATTAANAEICAITRIDLDHQQYLGDTIEEIADEKAAIIDGPLVTDVALGEQRPEAMDVLLRHCESRFVEPVTGKAKLDWSVRPGLSSQSVKLETNLYNFDELELGLKGKHQIENAQVAVSLSQILHYGYFDLPDEAVFLGLQAARHSGRLEYDGRYLFDGAHNAGGAQALAAYLDEFESRPITLLFGAMNDKPVTDLLDLLVPRAKKIVFTEVSNERSMNYSDLLDSMPNGVNKEATFATDSLASAIDIAETITPEDAIILVTGSLYLIGEAKKLFATRSQI